MTMMYTHEPGAALILVPLGATLRAQFSKGQRFTHKHKLAF